MSSSDSNSPKITVKQQREAQRAEKVEKQRQQRAAAARRRTVWIGVGVTAAVAIVALVVTSIVLIPKPAQYSAGSDGVDIAGVETFENAAGHVETAVSYAQTPPTGGDHNPVWLNCGVYTEPVPNENAVHALEHGAVWITYDPDAVDGEQIEKLRSVMPSTYAILSPYSDMGTPMAVSAWNAQLRFDSADDQRLTQFFEEYWQSESAPEPGAPCTGGVDGAGRA